MPDDKDGKIVLPGDPRTITKEMPVTVQLTLDEIWEALKTAGPLDQVWVIQHIIPMLEADEERLKELADFAGYEQWGILLEAVRKLSTLLEGMTPEP